MAIDASVPDPSLILDLLEAFRRSKTMFAASSLGVFDALDQGPKGLQELAASLAASEDGLERLLDASVGLGLLNRAEGRYSNTAVASAYLTSASPRRLTGYINFSNSIMWTLWTKLEDAVRDGSHRWPQCFGSDGPIFSQFFKSESDKREFLMGMHGFGMISSPQVVAAHDLSKYRCMVDLGGATGHLVIAACQRYANLKGIVFDLAAALPLAEEIVCQSNVADRIELMSGDFFSDPLPAADIFALGRILHDWTESKCLLLLQRIYDVLPSGGAILIAEKVLWEDKLGPRWAHMQSLNMLTCTEGKERSLAEYESLLTQVGFGNVVGCRLPAPLDAVLATKP